MNCLSSLTVVILKPDVSSSAVLFEAKREEILRNSDYVTILPYNIVA